MSTVSTENKPLSSKFHISNQPAFLKGLILLSFLQKILAYNVRNLVIMISIGDETLKQFFCEIKALY